jgi:hypothetical protein
VIIVVGSDKGSPGASTLALLLGMGWPGERLVAELDPRGADLPYRVTAAGGQPLASSPTITTLAIDTRPGAPRRPLLIYTQPAACGAPLLVGETSANRFARIMTQLPAIGDAFAAWSGTVIADLGCVQLSNPTLPIARAAAVVVLVTRADTASLGHLRERVEEIGGEIGGAHRLRSPLAVVVRTEGRDGNQAQTRVGKLLASVGSPATVLGVLPDDPVSAAAVCAGPPTKRLARSSLITAAGEISSRLRTTWPELCDPGPTAAPAMPGSPVVGRSAR